MIPWEIFIKKYNESTPEIQTLIDSDKIPGLSRDTLGTGGTSTKEVHTLTTSISDYILGLITKEELRHAVSCSDEDFVTVLNKIEWLQKEASGKITKESIKAMLQQVPVVGLTQILLKGSLSPADQKDIRLEIETRGTQEQRSWLQGPTGRLFGTT